MNLVDPQGRAYTLHHLRREGGCHGQRCAGTRPAAAAAAAAGSRKNDAPVGIPGACKCAKESVGATAPLFVEACGECADVAPSTPRKPDPIPSCGVAPPPDAPKRGHSIDSLVSSPPASPDDGLSGAAPLALPPLPDFPLLHDPGVDVCCSHPGLGLDAQEASEVHDEALHHDPAEPPDVHDDGSSRASASPARLLSTACAAEDALSVLQGPLPPSAPATPAPPSAAGAARCSTSPDGPELDVAVAMPAARAQPASGACATSGPDAAPLDPAVRPSAISSCSVTFSGDAPSVVPPAREARDSAAHSGAHGSVGPIPAVHTLAFSLDQADSSDEATVTIAVPSGTKSSQVTAAFRASHLDVKVALGADALGCLSGPLFKQIVPSGCAFHLEGTAPRTLVLDLLKKDAGFWWPSLFKSVPRSDGGCPGAADPRVACGPTTDGRLAELVRLTPRGDVGTGGARGGTRKLFEFADGSSDSDVSDSADPFIDALLD